MSLLTVGHWTGRPMFCETNPTGCATGADASPFEYRGLCAYSVVVFGKHRELRVISLAGLGGVPIVTAPHDNACGRQELTPGTRLFPRHRPKTPISRLDTLRTAQVPRVRRI